jgi:ATP-dependent helicase/nuclease subunit A
MPSPKASADQARKSPVLTPDRDLRFPEFVLLKASAGSGKTHALSLRFVQFLLSRRVGELTRSDLRNILAITFTKNAAREMKTRVLDWLKACAFRDGEKSSQVLEIVSMPPDQLPGEAEKAVERVLANYSDFQVETIDSFMAAVFRASAVDLGYSPDFEIVLDRSELVRYAFSRYLRRVAGATPDGEVFRRILELIAANAREEAAFPWDPTSGVLERLIELYGKLASRNKDLALEDREQPRAAVCGRIIRKAEELERRIEGSGLEKDARGHCHKKILPAVRDKKFTALLGSSFKTPPVRKPGRNGGADDYERILETWSGLEALVDEYRALYAADYFYPYLLAYRSLAGTLDLVKRREGVVFIEDINKQLAGYIDRGIVPDIYFRLGDRILHYLIDEFQDTSPIQWANMGPLIENSLAQEGSLFVVGDTKQAIYGFRDADYRIMRALEDPAGSEFLSAPVQVEELRENYRSREAIQRFVQDIFLRRANESDEYRETAGRSGLNDFQQEVIPAHRGTGHVESVILPKSPDGLPEKEAIQDRVRRLKERGYAYSDIAILTYKNESVADVASWLNEIDVPFIPFSSLDIRKRKITGEVLALLRFLDSPPDDLSFAVFLLSDVLGAKMEADGIPDGPGFRREFLFECRRTNASPLYVAFRERFPRLWDIYFEPLFKIVGYYPLYDLVTLVYRLFGLFELFPGEEAALARLLEAIKEFEGIGRNDLREFLEFTSQADGTASAWTIDVPSEIDAVRIMSIHKAKGLGFPVVILLLYGERWQAPDFFLGEDGDSVHVYKLTQDIARADEGLAAIYDEEKARYQVNRLNTLYVALTRARAELYVVGVKGKTDTYPFDLVGEEPFASSAEEPPACPAPPRPGTPQAAMAHWTGPFDLPPNRRETLNSAGIRRGEIVHRVLAAIEFLEEGWEESFPALVRDCCPGESEVLLGEGVARSIIRFFQGSPPGGPFEQKEGRRILREFDFCDATGRVFRMDRVVLDADEAAVVDFKTGSEHDPVKRAERSAKDREQVRTYMKILRDVFPGRPVRGLIARIDEGVWEAVE